MYFIKSSHSLYSQFRLLCYKNEYGNNLKKNQGLVRFTCTNKSQHILTIGQDEAGQTSETPA